MACSSSAKAGPIDLFDEITAFTSPWLLIGTGPLNDSTTPEGVPNKGSGNDAVDISNFEIGAIKAPSPANDPAAPVGFGTGEDWGPDLKFDRADSGNLPLVPGVDPGAGFDRPPGKGADGMAGTADDIFGVLPPGNVITYDGQVAITALDGIVNINGENGGVSVSNVGVFAKNQLDGGPIPDQDAGGQTLPAGIVGAGKANTDISNGGFIKNNSNAFFNDPNYPNPVNSPTTQPGDPLKVLEPGNGITGEFDFSNLRMGLDAAVGTPVVDGGGNITGFQDGVVRSLTGAAPQFCKLDDGADLCKPSASGATLDLTGIAPPTQAASGLVAPGEITAADGTFPQTLFVKLSDGLNIIDIDTGVDSSGQPLPLVLNNSNIIIDGSEDSRVVFRLAFGSVFDINNGNILIGDMGIMNMNVLFFADTQSGYGNDGFGASTLTVYDFDNFLVNGVAFWSLGDATGIDVDVSQGCVQYVSDWINLQDIRYIQCSYKGEVPEPGTLAILAFGLAGLGFMRRRRKFN